jgi:hypothetical protein
VGVASREVFGADGSAWRVRVYRFRAPRWRQFGGSVSEDPAVTIFWPVDIVLGVISAVVMGLIVPLLVIVVEMPIAAVRALFSDTRWIEATREGQPPDRMTWQTDAANASEVADQVARQLELGYDRVAPHNAVLIGFGDV